MSWFIKMGDDWKPGAIESMMHWQVIWPRAIARAWENAEFHDELKTNAHEAIKKAFKYELSRELELTVVDAPSDVKFEPGHPDPWHGLPKMKLTIAIPAPPRTDLQAVAITDYQDTGRTYPFTCC